MGFSMDDDDETLMDPQFDEFDLWERAAAASVSLQGKEHAVPELQKLFLEEIHGEVDANVAALKALKRLMASGRSPQGETPGAKASVQTLPMASKDADASHKSKVAKMRLQTLFQQELDKGSNDPNEAAAAALLLLRKTRAKATQISPPSTPTKDQKDRKEAMLALRRHFVEERSNDPKDPNEAAAKLLLQLAKARPVSSHTTDKTGRKQAMAELQTFFEEENNQGDAKDPNAAAVKVLMRLAKARQSSSRP